MPDENQPPSFDYGDTTSTPPDQPTQQQGYIPPQTQAGPNFGPPGSQPPKGGSNKKGCWIAAGITLFLLLLAAVAVVVAIIWGFNKASDKVDTVIQENNVDEILRDFTTTTVPGQTAPATESSVSLDEYNRIQVGMTYQQVVDLVGGPEITCGATSEATADVCTWTGEGISAVLVSFDAKKPNGVVTEKQEFGLN